METRLSRGPSVDLDLSQTVDSLCKILKLDSPRHLVKTISRLQKSVRAVPRMEAFIHEIGLIVDPHLEANKYEIDHRLSQIAPTLKSWTQEL